MKLVYFDEQTELWSKRENYVTGYVKKDNSVLAIIIQTATNVK